MRLLVENQWRLDYFGHKVLLVIESSKVFIRKKPVEAWTTATRYEQFAFIRG